jgi:hypothetical protein
MEKRAGAWDYEEMLRVLCLYASLDTADKSKTPKDVLEEVQRRMPHRTIASIQMRISNYIARDPEMKAIGIKGMFGGGDHVDEIWEKFSTEDGSLSLQLLVQEAAKVLGNSKS